LGRPAFIDCRGSGLQLTDQFIKVVVKVGQCRVDLFRVLIRMLTEEFFSRPTVVVMLGGEVNYFVSGLTNACGPSPSIEMCG
jgi:hypothetical protein